MNSQEHNTVLVRGTTTKTYQQGKAASIICIVLLIMKSVGRSLINNYENENLHCLIQINNKVTIKLLYCHSCFLNDMQPIPL